MSRAAHLANRAALAGCGLLLLAILLAAFLLPSSPAAAGGEPSSSESGATASIVNGKATTIGQWPWQVALTVSSRIAPRASTSWRFFCGGSVLAPRLVITAGHCVADLNRGQIRKIEIVSGRTRLNSNRGQVARVTGLRMPVNASGKRRFRGLAGAADWDVALLTLASPLSAEPIKLAGPDEAAAWSPGQVAWTTGWGITKAFSQRVPARLQVARQVLMGNGLCHRADGVAYKSRRMICMGAPRAHASACNGDSGGPLVVETGAGYRLVGLTSYGDGACRGFVPSVDTRVSGRQIRNWVARTAMNLTGRNVVGSGGTPRPAPDWCKVPDVFRLRQSQAKARLEAAGCRLGRVRTDYYSVGQAGRIVGSRLAPGWLAPPGFKVGVWVAP